MTIERKKWMKIYKIILCAGMMTAVNVNAAENIDGFNFINHLSQFFFRNEESARLREETQRLESDIEKNIGVEKEVLGEDLPSDLKINNKNYKEVSPWMLKMEELHRFEEELYRLDVISILRRCKEGDRRAVVVSGMIISSVFGVIKLFI